MEQFLEAETLIIELLLLISLVAIALQRVRLPYTVALVLLGLALAFVGTIQIELTSELILALFLPPLVFEAAFHIEFRDLRANLLPILALAIPGVIIVTFIVGGVVAWGIGLALPLALVFGALIAATDPVAVIAVFRALGVPRKLATIVEGESLFNDGTAIVVFNIILAVVATGHFNLIEGVWDFVRVSLGGIGVGLGLGWLCAQLIARVDDHLIETTLTTVLAFGAFLVAERFHFSGVLAVVAAGILNGNLGPAGMSPTTKVMLFNFWEYFAFLANSLIFLLIGLRMEIPLLLDNAGPILIGGVGLLLARIVSVYLLGWLVGLVRPGLLPLRWQHVLTWGGLRGAVSLALALGLPAFLGSERDLIQAMAFGVVLLTLVVQAPTMEPLIRFLKIIRRKPAEVEYDRRRGRLLALTEARRRLERMHDDGLLSVHAWEQLAPQLRDEEQTAADELRELIAADPGLEADEISDARRELLITQRSTLQSLRNEGLIDGEIFEELAAEVDARLEALH